MLGLTGDWLSPKRKRPDAGRRAGSAQPDSGSNAMVASYQVDCHMCGKAIPDNQSVQRVMKSAKYSGDRDYCRNVNLCHTCDANQISTDRLKKALLLVGALAALAVGITCILYLQ
jgi:hypothetical protein